MYRYVQIQKLFEWNVEVEIFLKNHHFSYLNLIVLIINRLLYMYYNFIIYFDLLLLKFSISMLNFQQDYV